MSAKYDFYKDVKDKKTLARNAKYKKNGSKSKKCTLPSDYLTRKEKQKMNSEVKTYKMNQKYSWKEFMEMPLDIQREYLIHLRDTYGVKALVICKDLFKTCGAYALRNYSYKHNNCFGGIFSKGRSNQTKDQIEAWRAFTSEPPSNPINKPAGNRKDQWFGVLKEGNSDRTDFEAKEELPAQKVKVSTCSITLSGPADVDSLCKSINNILNAQSNGRQVVSFKFKCAFSMEE